MKHTPPSPVFSLVRLAPWLAFFLAAASSRAADRYAGPAASGDGKGGSAQACASYLDAGFWQSVNADVAREPTTVHLLAGHYHAGPLTLTALGNDAHLLALTGEGAGAVFDSDGDFLLYLRGCQNLHLHNLHFTGTAGKFGVTVIGLSPEKRDAIIPVPAQSMHAEAEARAARDIDFDGCTWIDLPQVYYGPLCLSFHTDHVTVRNCTFQRCGQERHSHMMYDGGGSHHIFIYHNTFEDSSGTYVRFRDRSDYGYIIGNVFRTTGNFLHEDSSTTTFIEAPLFNSFDPGTESFGTNFVVVGNQFIWPAKPPKRDARDPVLQLNYHTRDAMRFWQDGFETRGYRTLLTKDEGYTMSLGSPSAKKALLVNNCGINPDRIVWYGNGFSGPVESKVTYACLTEFGAFAKSRGFDSYADITNAVTQTEVLADDFESDADAPKGWAVSQDAGTSVAMRFENAPGSEGTRCVLLSDHSTSGQCAMRWNGPALNGFYFSAWYQFDETTSDHLCLGDGVHRWVVAGRDGFWENDRGRCVSNATYIANKWYHVEVVMEEGAKDYSVWIDGVLVSKDIKDPAETVVAAHGGAFVLSPADAGGVGSMRVDDVRVAALAESSAGVKVTHAEVVGVSTLRVTFDRPLDTLGSTVGRHSALNPLNYKLSRRFFPDYDFTPVEVTVSGPASFDVRYQESLPEKGGFLWIDALRAKSGEGLSANSFPVELGQTAAH